MTELACTVTGRVVSCVADADRPLWYLRFEAAADGIQVVVTMHRREFPDEFLVAADLVGHTVRIQYAVPALLPGGPVQLVGGVAYIAEIDPGRPESVTWTRCREEEAI